MTVKVWIDAEGNLQASTEDAYGVFISENTIVADGYTTDIDGEVIDLAIRAIEEDEDVVAVLSFQDEEYEDVVERRVVFVNAQDEHPEGKELHRTCYGAAKVTPEGWLDDDYTC